MYSLGLAIPFVLSGYYMTVFLSSKKGFGKYYGRITKTGGVILLITGVLITTNQIQIISYYILTTFPFLTFANERIKPEGTSMRTSVSGSVIGIKPDSTNTFVKAITAWPQPVE